MFAGVAMVCAAVVHRIVALHYTNAEAEGHSFCMLMLWFDQVYTTAVAEGHTFDSAALEHVLRLSAVTTQLAESVQLIGTMQNCHENKRYSSNATSM
eukprot:1758-Heterococcus_DN1.PRE.3